MAGHLGQASRFGKSFERYGELLNMHVSPHIGAMKLQKVQPLDLDQLYGKLLAGSEKVRPLSASTVGYVHRVLHHAFKQAVAWKKLQSNSAAVARPPRVEVDPVEVVDSKVISHILGKLQGRVIYPIAVTALGTGMRRGELLALQWRNLDLDKATVRVEASLGETKAGGVVASGPKDRYGRRSISCPPILCPPNCGPLEGPTGAALGLGYGKVPHPAWCFPSRRWPSSPAG